MSRAPGFARRFWPVWAVGFVGVAALMLQAPPALLLERTPPLRELPEVAIRLLLLVNPLILVTVMAAAGAAVAHRVGLRSALAGDADARWDAGTALAAGAGLSAVLLALDAVFAGALGPGWRQVAAQAAAAPWLPALLLGVLYGGMAEEVMMRWGLMSLVVWGAARLHRRVAGGGGLPPAAAVWVGIATASVLFGLSHLPALAQSVELSAPIVVRTVGLNLLAGIVYGWLFWRRSLETAMLAHATTHVGFALARLLG